MLCVAKQVPPTAAQLTGANSMDKFWQAFGAVLYFATKPGHFGIIITGQVLIIITLLACGLIERGY